MEGEAFGATKGKGLSVSGYLKEGEKQKLRIFLKNLGEDRNHDVLPPSVTFALAMLLEIHKKGDMEIKRIAVTNIYPYFLTKLLKH